MVLSPDFVPTLPGAAARCPPLVGIASFEYPHSLGQGGRQARLSSDPYRRIEARSAPKPSREDAHDVILIAYASSGRQAATDHAGELLRGEPATVETVWEPFLGVIARTSAALACHHGSSSAHARGLVVPIRLDDRHDLARPLSVELDIAKLLGGHHSGLCGPEARSRGGARRRRLAWRDRCKERVSRQSRCAPPPSTRCASPRAAAAVSTGPALLRHRM